MHKTNAGDPESPALMAITVKNATFTSKFNPFQVSDHIKPLPKRAREGEHAGSSLSALEFGPHFLISEFPQSTVTMERPTVCKMPG